MTRLLRARGVNNYPRKVGVRLEVSWGWKHSAPVRLSPSFIPLSALHASDSPRLQIARATTQREQSIPILLPHFRSSCHLVRQFFLAKVRRRREGLSVTRGEGEERLSENESDGRREESIRPSCDVDDKRAIHDWQGGGGTAQCSPRDRARGSCNSGGPN